MSATVAANCPNCAWALKVGRERKLPTAERFIFIAIAERVSRFTLSWNGTIGALVDDTGLCRRKIQYVLKNRTIPADLLKVDTGRGCRYTFTILRPMGAQDAPFETNATEEPVHDVHPEDARDAPFEAERGAQGAQNPLKEESPKDSPQTQRAPSRERGVPDGFAEFWALYPRKVGKIEASKQFAKAVAKGNDPHDIIAALARQLPDLCAKENRYQVHPERWLSKGRFLDEQTPEFDPVLAAAGLKPEDFDEPSPPETWEPAWLQIEGAVA